MRYRYLAAAAAVASVLLVGCSDSGSVTVSGSAGDGSEVSASATGGVVGTGTAAPGGGQSPGAGSDGGATGSGSGGGGGSVVPGAGGSSVPGAGGSSAPAAGSNATCSASGLTAAANTTGASAAAAATANALRQAALTCDTVTLVARAKKDQTELSFGELTPDEAFALPETAARYAGIVQVLASAPGTWEGVTIWPRVASPSSYADPAAWTEAVAAGAITAEESRMMQEQGSGYYGWRVGITEAGVWQYNIAAD